MPQRSNSARYLWGDRNPVAKHIGYSAGGIAPHATTLRASYTTPTGKKAQIQSTMTLLRIATVAAVAGLRNAYSLVVSGATNYNLVQSELNADKNVVGNVDKVSLGVGALLLAGDSVSLYTVDTSTGGTIDYTLAVLITEYDT